MIISKIIYYYLPKKLYIHKSIPEISPPANLDSWCHFMCG